MMPSRSIPDLLAKFAAKDSGMKMLVVEAAVYLLLARIALLAVPFPKLARRLGTFVPPEDPRVAAATLEGLQAQAQMAVRVRRAMGSAARHVPFKAVCLPQAMAAQAMLRRRHISSVMHFGAGRGVEKPLEAHAWLDAAGVKVTGYPVAPHLAEIACFV